MREFLVILYILCFSAAAFAVETEHTPLLEGVFSVKAFGAAGDGSTKDTKAIQAALDTAAKLGGKVYFPPGKYLVDGSLNVPAGVHVEGVANAPRFNNPMTGSIILATAGRDDENAPALFEMKDSTCVSGLTVYYPDQSAEDIHPYPWTFHLVGCDVTVENVTLINSYNGLKVGPEGNVRHRIRSVYGCVLRRGIYVDACTDIGRIDNVQFHGHWWWHEHVKGNSKLVNDFIFNNLEAFIFGRTDWEYVTNTFVFPVKIGYRFIGTELGACNGQFSGIGADYAQRCIVVEEIQHMGLLITNGQFVAFEGADPTQIVIEASCRGQVRLVNCAFWGDAVQNVVSRGQSFLSLSDCFFSGSVRSSKPVVEVAGGKLQLRGCSFSGRNPSLALREGCKHAIVSENNSTRGMEIINEIGEKAILANNEMKEAEEPHAIVVRHTDTDGSFETAGEWLDGVAGGDYDRYSLWTKPGDGTKTATWLPDLPHSGKYKVYVWYGNDPTNHHSKNVKYTVTHSEGTDQFTLNQKENTVQWNLLGEYQFEKGRSASVTVHDATDEDVVADAMKFVPAK